VVQVCAQDNFGSCISGTNALQTHAVAIPGGGAPPAAQTIEFDAGPAALSLVGTNRAAMQVWVRDISPAAAGVSVVLLTCGPSGTTDADAALGAPVFYAPTYSSNRNDYFTSWGPGGNNAVLFGCMAMRVVPQDPAAAFSASASGSASVTASASPSPTPSAGASESQTPSPSPTGSATPSAAASPTATPSAAAAAASPSPSASPTASPSPSASPTASASPSPSPTASASPSPSPTAAASRAPQGGDGSGGGGAAAAAPALAGAPAFGVSVAVLLAALLVAVYLGWVRVADCARAWRACQRGAVPRMQRKGSVTMAQAYEAAGSHVNPLAGGAPGGGGGAAGAPLGAGV
jgi:hypothetical protein